MHSPSIICFMGLVSCKAKQMTCIMQAMHMTLTKQMTHTRLMGEDQRSHCLSRSILRRG